MHKPHPSASTRLTAALACLLAAAATAQVPAELLGPDLRAAPIHLLAIGGGRIGYFDGDRVQQTASLEGFVQVRRIGGIRPMAPPREAAVLLTSDGQTVPGRWVGASADGTAVVWEHAAIGRLTVPLTAIATLQLSDRPVPEPGSSDRVVLVNGDHVAGFVESVAPDRVRITPEGADRVIELPLDRVAGLALSNPARAPAGRLDRLVFTDGTRLWAADLAWSPDSLDFQLPADGPLATAAVGTAVSLDARLLARVDTVTSGWMLQELTALPREVVDGGQAWGLQFPPRRIDGDLALHAPVTVTCRLPAGARRLSARVELDLATGSRPGRRDLADCELVILQGDRELARCALSAGQPSAEINVPVGEGPLVLRLDEGRFGPILDRVRLRDAVLLVATAPTER